VRHEEIIEYNWDDGLVPIRAVVDSPDTQLATALLIYWRLEGPYMAASKPDDATRLNATVRERIVSGYYRQGDLRYDPIEDNRLSLTQVYKLERAGIPPVLLGRSPTSTSTRST